MRECSARAHLTDHTLPPDSSSSGHTNPCTNSPTTLSLHYLQYVSHTTVDRAGGIHFDFSAVIDVHTDDGFSGRAAIHIATILDPKSGIEGNPAVNHASFTLRNALMQVVTVDYVFRVLLKDGDPIVELDHQHLSCQGIPVA